MRRGSPQIDFADSVLSCGRESRREIELLGTGGSVLDCHRIIARGQNQGLYADGKLSENRSIQQLISVLAEQYCRSSVTTQKWPTCTQMLTRKSSVAMQRTLYFIMEPLSTRSLSPMHQLRQSRQLLDIACLIGHLVRGRSNASNND